MPIIQTKSILIPTSARKISNAIFNCLTLRKYANFTPKGAKTIVIGTKAINPSQLTYPVEPVGKLGTSQPIKIYPSVAGILMTKPNKDAVPTVLCVLDKKKVSIMEPLMFLHQSLRLTKMSQPKLQK